MKNSVFVIAVLTVFTVYSQMDVFAQNNKVSVLQGKNESNVSYMGMFSINGQPILDELSIGNMDFGGWSLSAQTSHGVYFSKQRLYTGLSLEYVALPPCGFMVNPHIRYYFAGHKSKVGGYVGVDAGLALGPFYKNTEPGSEPDNYEVYANAAVEVGMIINFSKVSLDIGIRPHYALIDSNFVLLPFKIGVVF